MDSVANLSKQSPTSHYSKQNLKPSPHRSSNHSKHHSRRDSSTSTSPSMNLEVLQEAHQAPLLVAQVLEAIVPHIEDLINIQDLTKSIQGIIDHQNIIESQVLRVILRTQNLPQDLVPNERIDIGEIIKEHSRKTFMMKILRDQGPLIPC